MDLNRRTAKQLSLWQERVHDLNSIRDNVKKTRLVKLSNYVVGHNTVILKMESEQTIRSFKIRGAMFAMIRNQESLRDRGVVANSGGNHAQAVALAGWELGIPATIIVPSTVPANKIQATRRFGATDGSFILDNSPSTFAEAKALAMNIAGIDQNGNLPSDIDEYPQYISPYDDPKILRGTATLVPEIYDQLYQAGYARPHSLHVPVGGGGLIGGIADVNAEQGHMFDLIGHGLEGANSGARSLRSHAPVYIENPNVLVEGLAVNAVGEQVHQRMRDGKIDNIYTSTLRETGMAYRWYIAHAMPDLGVDISNIEDVWNNLPELSSIVAVSGLFKYLQESGVRNKTHLVIITGGNVDHEHTMDALHAADC